MYEVYESVVAYEPCPIFTCATVKRPERASLKLSLFSAKNFPEGRFVALKTGVLFLVTSRLAEMSLSKLPFGPYVTQPV